MRGYQASRNISVVHSGLLSCFPKALVSAASLLAQEFFPKFFPVPDLDVFAESAKVLLVKYRTISSTVKTEEIESSWLITPARRQPRPATSDHIEFMVSTKQDLLCDSWLLSSIVLDRSYYGFHPFVQHSVKG